MMTILIFGVTLAAQSGPDGAVLYKKRCAMCHGADGKGFKALKTPDMTSPKWQASVKDESIADVIKNGKKGTAMPGFAAKLSAGEIKTVIAQVRSLASSKK